MSSRRRRPSVWRQVLGEPDPALLAEALRPSDELPHIPGLSTCWCRSCKANPEPEEGNR